VNSSFLYKLKTSTAITHLVYCQKALEALAVQNIQSAPRTLASRPWKRPRFTSTGDPEWLIGQPHFPTKFSKPKECVVRSDPASGQAQESIMSLTPRYALLSTLSYRISRAAKKNRADSASFVELSNSVSVWYQLAY